MGLLRGILIGLLFVGAEAFVVDVTRSSHVVTQLKSSQDGSAEGSPRRDAFKTMAALTAGAFAGTSLFPSPSFASGGATAGKYTTIPIAKRRYYGRVQQGVHDFLAMMPELAKADTTGEKCQFFFDIEGVVVVAARRQDISGQCTKKGGKCQGREIRDSRWNDMKTSMYLLGNAFRTDQQKPPDKLPTVKAAKAFFKEIDNLEKRATTKAKQNDQKSQEIYATALEILDEYLDLVELPPTASGHYAKDFDTLVGEAARIT